MIFLNNYKDGGLSSAAHDNNYKDGGLSSAAHDESFVREAKASRLLYARSKSLAFCRY